MKKLEFIFGLLAILSLLLNVLFLVPGAMVAMILGFGTLSILYMYTSFALFNGIAIRGVFKKESYIGIPRMRLVGAALTGIALSVTALGILFKMMSWPGANLYLVLGLSALTISLLVGMIRYLTNPSPFYSRIFTRIALYGGLAFALYFLPTEKRIDFQFRNHPAYRDAYIKALQDPDNQELWEQVGVEREKMQMSEE